MANKRSEAEWRAHIFPNEGKLQAYTMKRLNALPGITAFKVIQANRNGVSDIICCVRGRFVAIEMKNPKLHTKPTAHQKLFMTEVQTTGGVAAPAWSWGDVCYILASAGYIVPT